MIIFKKDFIYLFQTEGKGRKKRGRETSVCGCLSHAPPTGGLVTATQACALTGNWTSNHLVCRPTLNPLSHTSQGNYVIILTCVGLVVLFFSINIVVRRKVKGIIIDWLFLSARHCAKWFCKHLNIAVAWEFGIIHILKIKKQASEKLSHFFKITEPANVRVSLAQALCYGLHVKCLPETRVMIIATLQMENGKPEQVSDSWKFIQLLKRGPKRSPSFSAVPSSFPPFLWAPGGRQYSRMVKNTGCWISYCQRRELQTWKRGRLKWCWTRIQGIGVNSYVNAYIATYRYRT